MSREIALVVEAVENCTLPASSEYYVRLTIGDEKVGTHSIAPEHSTLEYKAVTRMPHSVMSLSDMHVEIIDSLDQVVGQRVLRKWQEHLRGQDKGVLTASVYSPNDLKRDESPTGREHELTPVGLVRIRVYAQPNFESEQKQYNRLDIYISKLSDIILDSLSQHPPHVLLRLGTSQGVDLSATPKRGAEDDWIWEEVVPFHYDGEDEVYFSVRDGKTDMELGKSVLSISQIAHEMTKSRSSTNKKAGYIPVNDSLGATIGMLLIGTELWDSHRVKVHTKIDTLKCLEERCAFDENLLKDMEKHAVSEGSPTAIAQADKLFVEGQIADARNNMQEGAIIRDESRQGLKSRRDIKEAHQKLIKKCDEAENHLEKGESRLYNMSCDMSRDLDKSIRKSNDDAQSIIKRCEIEANSSPRARSGSAVSDFSAMNEVRNICDRLKNLMHESHKKKQAIYEAKNMNTIPEDLDEHWRLFAESEHVMGQLNGLNDKIREMNEKLRQANRLEHLKEQEQLYGAPPPVVVQRSGLNCFSCCATPPRHLNEFQSAEFEA